MYPLNLYLGGSFDPIHKGHLSCAQSLLEKCQAQQFVLIPNAQSPLKNQQKISPEQRQSLIELALQDHAQISIDWREQQRGGLSYAVETMQQLANEHNDCALAFVMGQDSFNALHRWHLWEQLSDHCHIIVINRPGYPQQIPTTIQDWAQSRLCNNPQQLHQQRHGLLMFIDLELHDISSTVIRQLCQQADLQQLSSLLPEAVAAEIIKHRLYQA